MSKRRLLRRAALLSVLTVVISVAAAAGGPGSVSKVTSARANSCDPYGVGVEGGIYGYAHTACRTFSGYPEYQVCLQAASQNSGWSSRFACSGIVFSSYVGQEFFTQRTNCVTGVAYRAQARIYGSSTWITGPYQFFC
jgi:hypothetical protein